MKKVKARSEARRPNGSNHSGKHNCRIKEKIIFSFLFGSYSFAYPMIKPRPYPSLLACRKSDFIYGFFFRPFSCSPHNSPPSEEHDHRLASIWSTTAAIIILEREKEETVTIRFIVYSSVNANNRELCWQERGNDSDSDCRSTG